MPEPHHITLQIEGIPEDDGHVRLSHLIDRLQALQASINAVHKVLTRKKVSELYYRIIGASHCSPLEMVIEPVDIEDGPDAETVTQAHDRFFGEVRRLECGEMPSEDMSNEAIESLGKFVSFDPRRFTKVVVKNQSAVIELSQNARKTVEDYLMDEEWSVGSLTGVLDALDFHGSRRKKFFIYPASGPRRIECVFAASDPELKERVKLNVERRVRVYGRKHYRKNQKFPHSIHVSDLEEIKKPDVPHLSSLRGSLTSEKDSVETIRELRDGWD